MGGPDSQERKGKCVRVRRFLREGEREREREREESGDKCQAAISPRPNLAIFLRKCQIELDDERWNLPNVVRVGRKKAKVVTLFNAFNVIGIIYKVILLQLLVFCQEVLHRWELKDG